MRHGELAESVRVFTRQLGKQSEPRTGGVCKGEITLMEQMSCTELEGSEEKGSEEQGRGLIK